MINFLSNVRISRKIIGAFIGALCCTIGLGSFAIGRIAAVNDAAADIRQDWLPSTRILGDLAYHTMRFRQLEAAHNLAPADAKDAEAKTIATVSAQIDADLAAYAPHATEGDPRRLVETMLPMWKDYLGLDAKFLTISKAQDSATATALYRGEMRTVFNRFQDVLKSDVAFTVKSGVAAADYGAAIGDGSRNWILGTVGFASMLCLVIGWMLIRGIAVPLLALARAMTALARGDNDIRVPAAGRADEIGQMAASMEIFKAAAIEKLRLENEAVESRRAADAQRSGMEAAKAELAQEQAQVVEAIGSGLDRLSSGDLRFRIDQVFPVAYEKLRADFNGAMATLCDTMRLVATHTAAIRSGTGEISSAADDLSRRTEQQAASLEETAAALDEITATVRKAAEGADHARQVVGAAKTDAQRSGQVVRQAVEAMSGIEKSAQQIGQIIGVIDEIAFQTSLLALNAGVEAARAGDAGRGFAVVASEVRALAQRSADAAKEIKALISASGTHVELGVDLVAQTGRALERIMTQVVEINSIVGEISASAQEQAAGLDQVNTAINQMDQVTQRNAAMVEESTAASHALARETEDLSGLIARFQVGQEKHAAAAIGRRPTENLRHWPMRSAAAA